MTIIEAIQEVFESTYPNGTFEFTSKSQGDKNERYKDKTVSTPLCLIIPFVTGESIITNGLFNDRIRLKVYFLKSNTDNWTTDQEKETNLVEPMRQLGAEILTRVLYQYPSIITVDESTTIPHTDLYNWGSGNHAGVMFDFAVKQKRELNLCSTPITFDLTLSSGANGTTVPVPGTYNFDKGELTAAYADADAGYKFSQWRVNGAANLINPISLVMTKAYTVVAEFVVSEIKQLIIAVSGTGTTVPVPGTYPTEAGTVVPITATETDVLYYFEKFTVNGVDDLNNPITPTINENTSVVAYFLEYLQWVFNQGIKKIVDLYYFTDLTSFANNVQIKQSLNLSFDGIDSAVRYGTCSVLAGDSYTFRGKFYLQGAASYATEYILSFAGDKLSFLSWRSASGGASVLVYNGLIVNNLGVLPRNNNIYEYEINVTTNNIQLIINGVEYNAVISNIDISGIVDIGRNTSAVPSHFNGEMSLFEFENKILSNFKESWGTEIINRVTGGVNGTMIGFNETAAWANRSDYTEPLEIYPYTLFKQIADTAKFIRAIYDTEGNPTKTTITGYTNEGERPANVVSNTGAVYSGIQIAGLEVDATFAQVLAIENSATIEITKDANTVSLLKIKQ